jgi:hypothetical protein
MSDTNTDNRQERGRLTPPAEGVPAAHLRLAARVPDALTSAPLLRPVAASGAIRPACVPKPTSDTEYGECGGSVCVSDAARCLRPCPRLAHPLCLHPQGYDEVDRRATSDTCARLATAPPLAPDALHLIAASDTSALPASLPASDTLALPVCPSRFCALPCQTALHTSPPTSDTCWATSGAWTSDPACGRYAHRPPASRRPRLTPSRYLCPPRYCALPPRLVLSVPPASPRLRRDRPCAQV